MPDEVKNRELMDWFDQLDRDRKWRIVHYVIESGRSLADTLDFFKTLQTKERRHLRLVQPESKCQH